MRASRKFPPLPNTETQHQHRTLQSWDGLAISNTTPRDTKNIKKEICPIFNQNGLRITIEANKQTILFLDVTFKLIKTPSSPSQSLTPHYNTSTARATTRQPPQRTNPRHQQKAIIPFIWQSILRPSRSDDCGYRYTLHYEPPTTNNRKNRQRNNILWYNPPFSKNVSTNIGHSSLP